MTSYTVIVSDNIGQSPKWLLALWRPALSESPVIFLYNGMLATSFFLPLKHVFSKTFSVCFGRFFSASLCSISAKGRSHPTTCFLYHGRCDHEEVRPRFPRPFGISRAWRSRNGHWIPDVQVTHYKIKVFIDFDYTLARFDIVSGCGWSTIPLRLLC